MSHAYRYSIIRVRLFAETDKFANISPQRTSLRPRISSAIWPIDYEAAIARLPFKHSRSDGFESLNGHAGHVFAELTAKRESSIPPDEPRLIQAAETPEHVRSDVYTGLVARDRASSIATDRRATAHVPLPCKPTRSRSVGNTKHLSSACRPRLSI